MLFRIAIVSPIQFKSSDHSVKISEEMLSIIILEIGLIYMIDHSSIH